MAGKKASAVSAAAELEQLVNEVGKDLGDPGLTVSQDLPVPMNQPLMPRDLAASMAAASKSNAQLAKMDPATAQALQAADAALSINDRIATVSTMVGAGNSSVAMPAQARDTANALYYVLDPHNKMIQVKDWRYGRAGKLQDALFGPDISELICHAAGLGGHAQKPLVWLSQSMWHRLNVAMRDEIETDDQYDPATDGDPQGRLAQILSLMFEGQTLKLLQRAAKNNKASLLHTVRTLAKACCVEAGAKVPTQQEKEEWVALQRERLKLA